MLHKPWVTTSSMSVAYLAMVGVNALATLLPINGRTTGEISDSYPNLFAPAGITFSIWGVIYLLLGLYISWQLLGSVRLRSQLLRINRLFAFTSVLNILWILAWHSEALTISLLLMLALLGTLIRIADETRTAGFSRRQARVLKLVFGTYFGWITVATIANVTTLLVKVGWGGFGFSDAFWTGVVLCVGALIAVLRTWKDRNLAYGLVPVWAYAGILLKHTSQEGFAWQYPGVITTAAACIFVLVVSNGCLLVESFRKKV